MNVNKFLGPEMKGYWREYSLRWSRERKDGCGPTNIRLLWSRMIEPLLRE